MSGHNKWAQIKHKKAITDQKKGQIFSKIIRELTIVARHNPDPRTNYRLKAIIDKARSINMPQDNIDRALKKVSDKTAGELEEVHLEAIGPGNVALIISAITDSRNRTLGELRTLLSKLDVRLAQEGSLAWMFKKMGVIHSPDVNKKDELELAAIEAGAEDVSEDNEGITIYTSPENLDAMESKLKPLANIEADTELIPSSRISISPDDRDRLERILEAIEDHEDVQSITTNLAS